VRCASALFPAWLPATPTKAATASGERFDDRLPTAAHRRLPFGTKLRVSRGGRSVVVTVNDRAPFVRRRVLDLALAPARELGLVGPGIAHVDVEVVDQERSAETF
jgi:rare lipoprotein A